MQLLLATNILPLKNQGYIRLAAKTIQYYCKNLLAFQRTTSLWKTELLSSSIYITWKS